MLSTVLLVMLSRGVCHATETGALRKFLTESTQRIENLYKIEALLEQTEGLLTKRKQSDFLQAIIEETPVTFWDIPRSAWFTKPISTLVELGILAGYRDANGQPLGLFGPANPVTHAEATVIALRSAGVMTENCTGIVEHPQARTHWSRPFILCAEQYDLGINRTMDLNLPASRALFLHMILRAFDVEIPAAETTFADAQGHPFEHDIAFAVAKNIVQGDTDAEGNPKGTFRPDDPLNRAEAAAIALRALESLY